MSSTYCTIDGVSYDVGLAITEYEENFNVLDGENAGRVLTGRMVRDIIGTYVGHKITFRNVNRAAFDALWATLVSKSVKDSVMIEMADGQTTISYRAYYTSGTRRLKSVHDGVNYWDEIQINFIPISATVTP